jgi:hemin uptake protein HemP
MDVQLEPGAHLVIVTDQDTLSIEGRRAGLELRDTLAVLSSEGSRFAVLFRKPIVEATIVAQVLATGTGAININGTRVGGETRTLNSYTSVGPQGCVNRPGETSHAGREYETRITAQGRWPTNIVFVHAEGCRQCEARKVKGNATSKSFHGAYEGESNTGFLRGWSHSGNQHSDEDGLETIESWDCSSECLIPFLDVQSGVRPATLTGRANPDMTHTNPGDNHGASWFGGGNSNVYADNGGASRYYPQFANDAELFDWITQLITPPTEVS